MTRSTTLYDQPELFSDLVHRQLGAPPRCNEYGVYEEPDEILAITTKRALICTSGRERRDVAIAEIELLHLPGKGWIGSYAYSFSQGGVCGPLSRDRPMAKGDTRAACLQAAAAKLGRAIEDYVSRRPKPPQDARRALRWLASGCAPTAAAPAPARRHTAAPPSPASG